MRKAIGNWQLVIGKLFSERPRLPFTICCLLFTVTFLSLWPSSFGLVFADEPLGPITGLKDGYQGKELSDAPTTMELLISNVVGFLTVCAGLEFAIYMILAGLTWITAREESSRLSKAKDMFVNALIGLAFVVGAWAFTGVMQTVFGFDILSPARIIENYLTPDGKGEGRGGKAVSPAPCLNFDKEGDECLD